MKDELCHCGTISDAQDIAVEIFKQHFGPDCCPVMMCQVAEHLKKLGGGALAIAHAEDAAKSDKPDADELSKFTHEMQRYIEHKIAEYLVKPSNYAKSRDAIFAQMDAGIQKEHMH